MFLYFRLILTDRVGAILKPFAALISYIPNTPVMKDCSQSTRHSPFDALVGALKFISTSAEFLSRMLRLRQLGIKFGLGSLMLSIKKVNRSLAFYYLRIQFLLTINLVVGEKVSYQYLQLTIQGCHFLPHGLNASLESLLFSDFTAKVSFLQLELMKFILVRPQNISPAFAIVLKVLLLFFGVSPATCHE